mgnify:CR=1 FL=1
MYVKDSRELALEWEAANSERAVELNDLLDSYATIKEKRDFYATLSEEEKDGMMSERMRRQKKSPSPYRITSVKSSIKFWI